MQICCMVHGPTEGRREAGRAGAPVPPVQGKAGGEATLPNGGAKEAKMRGKSRKT